MRVGASGRICRWCSSEPPVACLGATLLAHGRAGALGTLHGCCGPEAGCRGCRGSVPAPTRVPRSVPSRIRRRPRREPRTRPTLVGQGGRRAAPLRRVAPARLVESLGPAAAGLSGGSLLPDRATRHVRRGEALALPRSAGGFWVVADQAQPASCSPHRVRLRDSTGASVSGARCCGHGRAD